MRRTDDYTILQMKQEGKTGREIATYFGVSPAYICKRLKRLQPIKEPESFAKLSEKQKKFVLAKAEGKTNTDAALEAFDVTGRDSAKALGHNMMKDPDVGRAISDIMAEEGLTRRHIVRRLKDLVDHPDGNIAARSIDISAKMQEMYPKQEVGNSPVIQITENRLYLIAETMAEIGEVEGAKRTLGLIGKGKLREVIRVMKEEELREETPSTEPSQPTSEDEGAA